VRSGAVAAEKGDMYRPEITAPEVVIKPWGREVLFAVLDGGFVGKELHVRQGHSPSLQYHRDKDEVIYLVSGDVILDLGSGEADLAEYPLEVGQSARIRAGVWHRIVARSDSVLLEVATASAGWREDVVRIRDNYGREGTSRP
jgi:mannose-6-phosphate isomerase